MAAEDVVALRVWMFTYLASVSRKIPPKLNALRDDHIWHTSLRTAVEDSPISHEAWREFSEGLTREPPSLDPLDLLLWAKNSLWSMSVFVVPDENCDNDQFDLELWHDSANDRLVLYCSLCGPFEVRPSGDGPRVAWKVRTELRPALRAVVERAYGRKELAEGPRPWPLTFRTALSIVDGDAFEVNDERAEVIMFYLRNLVIGVDIRINARALEMRRVEDNQRKPEKYPLELAPHFLRRVMEDMNIDSVPEATVGLLIAGDATQRTVWIVPRTNAIDLYVGPLINGARPPTGPVPDGGPWRLPAPAIQLPWRPTHRAFRTGLACPHCRERSHSYRALGDTLLMCGACSRSFDHSSG